MTLRAGRHLAYFGFAALIGVGLEGSPAAAQSYLADNSQGQVTVDYSVLGGGYSGVSRSPLPGDAMPSGACSCANAPMGVIAAAPRPTFNNPFGANLAMSQPAVPPGFMTYAQATGTPAYSGNGGAVVLHAPSAGNAPQMAEMTPPPNQPATTESANEGNAAPAPTTEQQTQTAELPKSTPTQSGGAASASSGASSSAANPPTTGSENAPSQPEQMPTNVPSPVGPGDTVANVAQAPTPPAAGTEGQSTENTQATQPTTNTQGTEAPTTNTQGTEATNTTPPAQPSTEQQAAATPTPPASSGNAAPSGGALPAGAYRIAYTGDSDDVPAAATGDLDKVAQAMQADPNMRIQILAYAAGTEDTESKARRKSLARGLAVRSYLLKAGIASTRMDVRALGSKADGGPADRVDIVPAS